MHAWLLTIENPEAEWTQLCYLTDASLYRGELIDVDGRVWRVVRRVK